MVILDSMMLELAILAYTDSRYRSRNEIPGQHFETKPGGKYGNSTRSHARVCGGLSAANARRLDA